MKFFSILKHFDILLLFLIAIPRFFPKRVSEKGQECSLPFTHNNQIYSDCVYSSLISPKNLIITFLLEDYKKEWCFLDNSHTSWGFCKPIITTEPFYLIKNLLKDKKTYFCLYQNPYNLQDLFAIDCLQAISEPNKMLWLWNSQTNQIFLSDSQRNLCIKNNSILLCDTNEKNSWFLDEFGRFINENTGLCMVLSEFEEKNHEFSIRKINVGHCEGFVIKIEIRLINEIFNRIMILEKYG